jgi:hypothetical protein
MARFLPRLEALRALWHPEARGVDMTIGSPYLDILKLLRAYGPLDADFVADRLGRTVTETRVLLDTLENAGAIQKRGEYIMIAGDKREPALPAICNRR